MDLYRKILMYNIKQKWLDTIIDSSWDTNSFQLYAGDLYDIIPETRKSVPARTRLVGTCSTINDSNTNFSRNSYNQYRVTLNYDCEIKSESDVKLMKFQVLTNIILKTRLEYDAVRLAVDSATGTPTFSQVGDYVVTNK